MNESEIVLVTGANGFVGASVCRALKSAGYQVRGTVRDAEKTTPADETVVVGEIDNHTDWTAALAGVSAVIHCAGRVHVMKETAADPLMEFRRVNVEGSRRLAGAMAAAGVKRMVFVSSIGVNGESGAFDERSVPHPKKPYAVSKWEAEHVLRDVGAKRGVEIVIVRPPLVYGKDARGNFARLVKLVRLGLPLPFGNIENRRTLIGVENLAHFLTLCVAHPAAAGETFVIGDDQYASTPDLIRWIGEGLGKPVMMVPFPLGMLEFALSLVKREALLKQLSATLTVDSRKAKRLLGWSPLHTTADGVRRSVL